MPARLFLEMIDHSKPVRVFRNWKHECYSIMQDGRLRASAKQVRLANVEFQVRESGRQRMLVENRRNVHAFAVGQLLDFVHPDDERNLESLGGRGICYDPSEAGTFIDQETRSPVISAVDAQFDEFGAVYRTKAA